MTMIQSNRVTIIPSDGIVHLDQGVLLGLKLDNCNIPNNINALQFFGGTGHIEFIGDEHNQEITELPDWAINCINQYELASAYMNPHNA